MTRNCLWVLRFHSPAMTLGAVIGGLGAAAALPQGLPVFESGVDVFDAGWDAPVCPVVVIAVDRAGVVRVAVW